MRIEKKEVQVWRRGIKTREAFEDKLLNTNYGRIVAGFGWPYLNRPGVIVAVGEDLERDFSLQYSPRHLYLIDEFESTDFEALHRNCLRFKEQLFAKSIRGNADSPLFKIWSKNFNKDSSSNVYITNPPNHEILDMNMATQLIRLHLAGRKTLHFGSESMLRGYLTILQDEDLEKRQLEHHPAILALACVLDEMNSGSVESLSGFQPDRSHLSWAGRARTSRYRAKK